MNNKILAIAYCSDNQDVANKITQDLQRVHYNVKPIPCASPNGLKKAIESEEHPILLIISDNFLKSTHCMHESLAMIQVLNAKKQFLPIITAGRYEKNGAYEYHPTTFERVSNVIQYMNHWQDAYLAMRREKRQMNDQESIAFEDKLKKVRTISSEVGEFLRYLRNTNYVEFEALQKNHYENVFRLVNDQTAFYDYKNLSPAAIPTPSTKEKTGSANATINTNDNDIIIADVAPNGVTPLTKENNLESSIKIEPEVSEVIANLPEEAPIVTPDTPKESETEVTSDTPESLEENTIPAGALMVDGAVEETEISGTKEPEEKGVEAGASHGILAAFQEGMENNDAKTTFSNQFNESQPEAEEDPIANFDLNSIPGMDQLGIRPNGNVPTSTQSTDNQPTNSSSNENDITHTSETTLEDLMSETTEKEVGLPSETSLNQIIEETVAEENGDDLLDEIEEEDIINIEDIFAEDKPETSTPDAQQIPTGNTIEALIANSPTTEAVPTEISEPEDISNIILTSESDDEVLDDLMEHATEETVQLPNTLEQMIATSDPATEEVIEETNNNNESLEDMLATSIDVAAKEEDEDDEPISWNDLVKASSANPDSSTVLDSKLDPQDEDNEDPIRWDELVAASEAQTAKEINAIANITIENPQPITTDSSKEWIEMAMASADLGATLAHLEPDFDVIETKVPLSPKTTIAQANEYFANGQIDEGLQLYKTQINQRPEHSELRYQYALGLMKEQNDFAQAGQQLEYLLEKDDTNTAAYFTLAELAEMQGDALQAKMYYEKVAALNPDYQDIDYRLGIVNLTQPDDHNLEAAKHFKSAIKKNPKFADAYYQLALLLKNYAEKPDKAVKFFDKTLQIDPKHPFAAYDLADTQQVLGNTTEAAAAYAKAININPDLQTVEKDNTYLPNQTDSQNELLAAQAEIKRLEDLIAQRAAEEQAVQGIAKMAAPDSEVSNQSDKIVMITGATSGIGRATAEVFARNGYRLVITGRRVERLEQLEIHFKESYNTAVQTLPFDVRDITSVKNAIEQLDDEWQQVDILINNAGLASGFAPIHEGDLEDWEKMIDTNLKGLLYMTRAIAPHMVNRRSGHIINIGSIAGKQAYPNGNVYNATKFAVDGLTQAMRLDLYQHNIRVSQVAPGHVEETEFAKVRFHGDEERAKIYEDFQPLTSKDVAETIYFIVTRPPHVNVQDVLIMGTQQGGATFVDRSGR